MEHTAPRSTIYIFVFLQITDTFLEQFSEYFTWSVSWLKLSYCINLSYTASVTLLLICLATMYVIEFLQVMVTFLS